MITKFHAVALRRLIEKLSANLNDYEALAGVELFPKWSIKAYETGDRVQYSGVLYKCLQSHTAQADWTPDTSVSLWVRVDDPSVQFPEWHQPQGAHDAYMTGDKVSHAEKHWISDIDYNTYEPSVYGWSEVL